MMAVGVASTIFVGRISKEAISAVGLINTLVGFIMVLFVALSTGCTVLVARLIGENEINKAKDTVRQSVVLGAAVSLLLSIICYIFAWSIITLFFSSADDEVIRLAEVYFRITLYSFPLTLVNIIISGSLRGAGDTRTPMIIAVIVNIINVSLNAILVFGVDSPLVKINGLGLVGAAIAVSVSRAIGGMLSLGILFLPGNIIRIDIRKGFNMDYQIIRRIFKIGIPAALEQIVMQGGFLVLQIVIAGMGTAAIAVYQVGMSINSMCFVPIWGFGIAATTLVGQSLGAKKPDIAEKCGWSTLKISLCVTGVLTLIIFIFAQKLVMIYSNDLEVITIGTTAIRIFSISQPFLAVVVVFSNGLRGAGDIIYVMITSFIGIWVFRILLTVVLDYLFHMGIMGVWVALCFDFLIRAIMYIIRFKRGRWKQITV